MLTWPKNIGVSLGAYFGVVLALNLLCSYELSRWPGSLISLLPNTDMEVYLSNAQGILDGTWPPPQPYYQAPLYPYVLAGLLACCQSLLHLAWAQGVLHAVSLTLMVALVGMEWGRRPAIVAGGLLLGYGAAMYPVNICHSTMLELFLACAFLFAVAVARRNVRGDPSWLDVVRSLGMGRGLSALMTSPTPWSILTGGFYALLCLARPNFLILAPFAIAGFCWDFKAYRIPRQRFIPSLAIVMVTAAALLSVAIVRNNRYSDRFVLLSTNGAPTYRIANSRDSVVFNFVYPQKELMKPNELDFWRHQWKKAVGYWWSAEVPQNDNYYQFRNQSVILGLLRVPFAVFGATTLVGSMLLLRRFSTLWPYYLLFWLYYATVVAFFIIGRFRLPGLPAMVVLSVGGLCSIWQYFQFKKYGRAALAVGATLLLFHLMEPRSFQVRYQDHLNMGICTLTFREPAWAELYFAKAFRLSQSPNDAVALILAQVLQGQYDDTDPLMQEMARLYGGDMLTIQSEIAALKAGNNEVLIWRDPAAHSTEAPPRQALAQLIHLYQAEYDRLKQKHHRIFPRAR